MLPASVEVQGKGIRRVGTGGRQGLWWLKLLLAAVLLSGRAGALPEARAAAPGSEARPVKAQGADAVATAAEVTADGELTRFRLTLSEARTAEIYTLANPYRIIIDLPSVSFHLNEAAGGTGAGLVTAFRYGLFAEGKARVVLDASGPVRISKAAMAPVSKGAREQLLEIEFVGIPAEEFGAGTGAARAHTAAAKVSGPVAGPKKAGGNKPIVVIDPGHGGIDGGAVGLGGEIEKSIVLAVGRELEKELRRRGRSDVRMTRNSDVFVSLDRRLEMSREQGADLFISLHADTLAEMQFAHAIRGATVYTLSSKASNEEAQRMAEKENRSDLLAGIDTGDDEEGDEVKGILIDLMRRETANFSRDFSNVLVPRLSKAIPMAKDGQRSAAFKVLKQTHAPSVLIELGYLSHPDDLKLLSSTVWQQKAAQAIADAVEAYFAKRSVASP